MKVYAAVAMVLFLGLYCVTGISYAQEETQAQPQQESVQPQQQNAQVEPPAEETEYSYGTVSSISANQIVVKEYDYDSDTESDVTYEIDPAVTLEGVASVSEIAAGDTVDVEYIVKDNKKVAKILSVEKESMPEGTAGPAQPTEGPAQTEEEVY